MFKGKDVSLNQNRITMATIHEAPAFSAIGHSRRTILFVGMASSAVTAAVVLIALHSLNPGGSARRSGAGRSTAPVSLAAPARFGTGRGMAAHPRAVTPQPPEASGLSFPADGTPPAPAQPGPRGRGAAFRSGR